MATYEITGPDGNKYQVVGPEGATEEDVTKYVQSQMTGAQSVRKTSTPPNVGGGEIDVSGGTQLRAAAQGIPFVGGFVSPTAESERFEQAFPKTAAADKVIAGELATAPIFGLAGGGLRGMAAGGALGAGDTAARGGDPGQIALGGSLGALSSATGRATGGGTANLITPHMATPEHQTLVNTLQREVPNLQMSAGQEVGSTALRIKEQERGRAIDINPDERLQRSVTQELMTRVGHPPTLADQPNMRAALQSIGDTFDRVLGRNDLTIDQPAIDAVHDIVSQYHLTQDEGKIRPYFGEILANMQPGKLVPGENYQIVRSQLARMQRATGADSADAENAHIAGQIKDILDDNFERSIANNPNTNHALGDLGALQQARSDYRNFLTLERGAGASNQQANYGYITPEALQSGLKATEGIRSYATGRGDLSELANAYAGVGRSIPNSMTAERTRAQNAERNLALILGGAETGNIYGQQDENKDDLYARYGSPAAGALGGYALSKGVGAAQGRFLFNPVMQGYLRNQIMTPQVQAILRALGAGAGTSTVPQTQPAAQTILNTLTGNKTNAPQQ